MTPDLGSYSLARLAKEESFVGLEVLGISMGNVFSFEVNVWDFAYMGVLPCYSKHS